VVKKISKEKAKQNVRDECVKSIAEELKADNWQVKANAEGYEKPPMRGVFFEVILHVSIR